MGTSLVVVACTSLTRPPDLAGIYDASAQYHGPDRNPVVLIPGFTGTRLEDAASGRIVWGAFSREYVSPSTADGARLIALPMREGVPLVSLVDEVRPNGAIDRFEVSILGLPFNLAAYRDILSTLGIGGYRDETLGQSGAVDYGKDHFTCFQFDYDWRRDVAENASRLDSFLLEKQAYVTRELEKRFGPLDHEVHFDMVAHSMGGLVARWYLMYGGQDAPADGSLPAVTWKGADIVDRTILIGTPNAGALDSLFALTGGFDLGFFLPTFQPALLGTFPSLYEMLPRARHQPVVDPRNPSVGLEDLFDPSLWERMHWGLADPRQDRVLRQLLPDVPDGARRREIALDHLKKCLTRARQVTAALDRPVKLPSGVQLYLIAGDSTATPLTVVADPADSSPRTVRWAPGDGTVLRSSALLDERVGGDWKPQLVSPIPWTNVLFLFANHLGLTRDPVFIDYVLFLLLEDPRIPHFRPVPTRSEEIGMTPEPGAIPSIAPNSSKTIPASHADETDSLLPSHSR